MDGGDALDGCGHAWAAVGLCAIGRVVIICAAHAHEQARDPAREGSRCPEEQPARPEHGEGGDEPEAARHEREAEDEDAGQRHTPAQGRGERGDSREGHEHEDRVDDP